MARGPAGDKAKRGIERLLALQQSKIQIPDHMVHGAQSFVDAEWKHAASGKYIEGEHSREPASPSGTQKAAP